MRKVLFSLACLATIGLAQARADVDYRYVADQSSYTGNVGDIITVNIYFRETLTNGSTSIIFGDQGLFGASVLVTQTSPVIAGGTQIAGSGSGTVADPYTYDIVPNTTPSPGGTTPFPGGFGGKNFPTIIDASTFATPTQSGLIVNAESIKSGSKVVTGNQRNVGPNFPDAGTNGSRDILIGTLNFLVGSTTSTYQLTNYHVVQGGTVFDSQTTTQAGKGLDVGTQAANGYTGASTPLLGFFTFTVGSSAIPEPSSMALCGLIGLGASYAGYRRRKAAVTTPVAA